MALSPVNIPSGTDDDRLEERFAEGDPEVFAEFYRAHANQLLAYGKGLGFDRETLKDAIQDIFYKLYTDRALFDEVRNVRAYLFRALKNRLLNSRKVSLRNIALEPVEATFSISVNVMDELIAREDRTRLERQIGSYMDSLTDRQREAVYLRFIEGFDYDEMAGMLGMTPHAARKLVSRAIISIRDRNLILLLILHSSLCIRFNG